MLSNKQVYKKLTNITEKMELTLKMYSNYDIEVTEFFNELNNLMKKLEKILEQNTQIIEGDPKLTRVYRTIHERLSKYIEHYNNKYPTQEKESEIE